MTTRGAVQCTQVKGRWATSKAMDLDLVRQILPVTKETTSVSRQHNLVAMKHCIYVQERKNQDNIVRCNISCKGSLHLSSVSIFPGFCDREVYGVVGRSYHLVTPNNKKLMQ